MQRIGDLLSWRQLKEGETLKFNVSRPRIVRLNVNSSSEVSLFIVPRTIISDKKEDVGDPHFLALVRGLDVIEFFVHGPFAIVIEGAGAVSLKTADSDLVHMDKVDERVFARLHQRRERNYEFELMARVAEQNASKRLAKMEQEIVARIERERSRDSVDGAEVKSDRGKGSGSVKAGDAKNPDAKSSKAGGLGQPSADGKAPPSGGEDGD